MVLAYGRVSSFSTEYRKPEPSSDSSRARPGERLKGG